MKTLFLDGTCKSVLAAFGKETCATFKGLPKGFLFSEAEFQLPVVGTFFDEFEEPQGTALEIFNGLVPFTSDGRRPQVMAYYPNVTNMEANGGDVRTSQEGFGGTIPNGRNAYSETYTIIDGGECLYKQLIKLQGREMRMFKIDDRDVLYGTLDKSENIKGYKVHIAVTDRPNNGANVGAILLNIYYTADYQKERESEIAISLGDEIKTLRILTIKNGVGGSAVQFQIVYACSGRSITTGNPALAAAIASAQFVDNWVIDWYGREDGMPSTLELAYLPLVDAFTYSIPTPVEGIRVAENLASASQFILTPASSTSFLRYCVGADEYKKVDSTSNVDPVDPIGGGGRQ